MDDFTGSPTQESLDSQTLPSSSWNSSTLRFDQIKDECIHIHEYEYIHEKSCEYEVLIFWVLAILGSVAEPTMRRAVGIAVATPHSGSEWAKRGKKSET